MKKKLLLLPLICLSSAASAQQDSVLRTLDAGEVMVKSQRLLKDIGVQKTSLDTFSLRENVTNSLADVLSQNSSIFIKSYGRATMATASFRGTAPSHTQVTWNGMKLNSPMLGMVDFSMIPSYFIDNANLYHGASSTGVTGGGLGGAVTLGTQAIQDNGFGLRYIQGISSYSTFDEFLRLTYGGRKWQSSTRLYYASSDNDFKYTNYRKKIFETDENGKITGSSYPTERNKNGAYKDLHVLQEIYGQTGNGNRWGLSVWYLNSTRGVPMLNVNYKDEDQSKNEQKERTLRAVATWDRLSEKLKLAGKAGYTYTDMRYIYSGDAGDHQPIEMIHSQSYVHTAFARFDTEYYLNKKWLFIVNISANQHFVKSMDRAVQTVIGDKSIIGYDKARLEMSGFASVKYRPTERLGIALNLREELYGNRMTPVIPGGFIDYLVSEKGNVVLKASIARNYRYPTLNDLYFMPGGNDTLRTEKGYTYDGGVEFTLKNDRMTFRGEISAYDSHIRDWIVWLPTFKGFWSPVNVKKVHSYGLEIKGRYAADFSDAWHLMLDGNFAITHSVNHGDPINWADESIGKQLVYIPVYSAAVSGKLRWKSWLFGWKWNYYSERFTTSSNETATKIGVLPAYYMNDISLEKRFSFPWADFSAKINVNNLFNEEYESVLSRPMAGRNFGLFLEIIPRFRYRQP